MIMAIKARREAAGMNQQQLADSVGVIRSAVANWELEISLPKTRDLPLLARVLGCSIDALFASDAEADAAGPPDQLEAC